MSSTRRRSWYVVDMDDGIVRREETKAGCLAWAMGTLALSERVLPGARRLHHGFYEYFIGPDREDCVQVWIARGDVAASNGFNLGQRPLYPHPDRPHERVEREKESER